MLHKIEILVFFVKLKNRVLVDQSYRPLVVHRDAVDDHNILRVDDHNDDGNEEEEEEDGDDDDDGDKNLLGP